MLFAAAAAALRLTGAEGGLPGSLPDCLRGLAMAEPPADANALATPLLAVPAHADARPPLPLPTAQAPAIAGLPAPDRASRAE